MYIVIVGAGEIGEKLIDIALKNKDDVVVIEKDKEKCNEISEKYDVVVVNGDATEKEVLEKAEVRNANALVTTADDATNLMVISLVKMQEMKVPSLVSVVNNEASKPMFIEKGVNIVGNPSAITAEYLYRAIRRPMVKDFMALGSKAEIFKIKVPEGSKIAGKTLEDLKLPRKVSRVVAIERNSDFILPEDDTVIREGDIVTILARKDKIDKIMDIFSRREKGKEND